jgi:hypothetical protein
MEQNQKTIVKIPVVIADKITQDIDGDLLS